MMSKKLIEPGSLANADFAKVEEAVMAQVKIDTSGELEWATLDNIMFFSGDYRIIRRQEWFDLRHKSGPYGTFALIASPKTLADAKQAAEYHFAALQTHEQDTAPAATDTGLETVAWQAFLPSTGWVASSPSSIAKDKRELVTRSQAEALLVAKDAENSYLKELVAARGETVKRGDDRIRKLEADNAALIHDLNRIKDHETELVNDNAAKDARIKELEAALDSDPDGPGLWRFWSKKSIELSQQLRDKTNTIKALEAKLAAAEKALEPFAKAALGYDDPDENGPWPDIQDIFVTLGDCRRARAVWGGKSS